MMNFHQVQIMWYGLYISFFGSLLSYLFLPLLFPSPLSSSLLLLLTWKYYYSWYLQTCGNLMCMRDHIIRMKKVDILYNCIHIQIKFSVNAVSQNIHLLNRAYKARGKVLDFSYFHCCGIYCTAEHCLNPQNKTSGIFPSDVMLQGWKLVSGFWILCSIIDWYTVALVRCFSMQQNKHVLWYIWIYSLWEY